METLDEKRKAMERESWINNVIRVMGFSREKAEEYRLRIEEFSEGRPKISVDDLCDRIAKQNTHD